jgi:transposase InsO family protein
MDHDVRCGRKRVARLMRNAGLEGVHRRRRQGLTRRDLNDVPSDDLVDRNFTPDAPNRLWVADITQQRCWDGWLYVAVVLDAFSRRIVGWSMADHLRTELVLDALNMAVAHRRPEPGVVHHSDHGCQGELNWSSQHLDCGGACRWRRCGSDSAMCSSIEDRSLHRGGRPSHGVKTASGSGRRSLAV